MKKLIKTFVITGACEIYVDKVCKAWNDKFAINQWHDEYRLVKFGRGQNCAKITISAEQAKELIGKLELRPIQSSILIGGKMYRTCGYIEKEIKRVELIQKEKRMEAQIINNHLYELEKALETK